MLSPGDKVKDCEVIAPLGSGGMATLYLARRRGVGGFSRLVTLKLVHQHLVEDENIIKLFLDEARISAHVAHPNVVHVEEVGEYAGSYFIAMEYVHGVSLAELLSRLTERRKRLRPKLCVWLAAQIAEALHAAHEATGDSGAPLDIVHRDVSPQNVLIGHTGHVKLIDFGIAKSQAETRHRSGQHPVLGKLRYMSPEQLRLERADRRTDVYALGVMLWEMLAGRNLLRCQRFDDERDWATRETPPPPSKYSAHSTPSLDRVVLKAIAYEPSERYDSAFQFRSALLRADPAAVQLDAPKVAALLRTMFGDELERRRANWPVDVVGELELTPDIATLQNWSVDELTAENLGIPVPGNEPEELSNNVEAEPEAVDYDADVRSDDVPTLAMRCFAHSLGSLGDGWSGLSNVRPDLTLAFASNVAADDAAGVTHANSAVVMLPARVITPRREPTLKGVPLLLQEPASASDTLKVPPVHTWLPAPLLQVRAFGHLAIGGLCLVLGVCIGTLTTRPEPRSELALDPTPRMAASLRQGCSPPTTSGQEPVRAEQKTAIAAEAERGTSDHTPVRKEPRTTPGRRNQTRSWHPTGRASLSLLSKTSANHKAQLRLARNAD